MLNIRGRGRAVCGGVTRRELLQAGGAGLLGMHVGDVLAAEAESLLREGSARSVIFLFLFGGPCQLETFDMKPEAPDTIRGPFKPIASRTPGLRISEHLPRTAAISDKLSIVRTMSHSYNDHSGGGHYIQTGHRWHLPIGGGFNVTPDDWPSMGSITDFFRQQAAQTSAGAATVDSQRLPNYFVLPNSLGRLQNFSSLLRRPGETAGWLGRTYDPVTTFVEKRGPKDNPYWRDCDDDELTYQIQGMVPQESLGLDRLDRRRSLLQQFDEGLRTLDQSGAITSYTKCQQRALSLVTSQKAREALDIRKESVATRDRYGRHLFGQSALMARRLVEAGVRFTTVHYDCVDGYSWDSHRNSADVQKHLLPTFDQTLSALVSDLDERGLLDETLVVAMGEMGRTPKANKNWGRDHWSTLFPAVLAGGGIRRGIVYGETDAHAAYARTQPTSPEDLAATIYHALGIDAETRVNDRQGRPVAIVDGGHPVHDLFG